MLNHPQFNPDNYDQDIAIVWLMRDFEYGLKVQPIELPTQDFPIPVDQQAVVTGWGATKVRRCYCNTTHKTIVFNYNMLTPT